MDKQEITNGIELICKTSKEIKGYYDDHDQLIRGLNSVPKKELDKCFDFYASRTGVIVDLRKELIEHLRNNGKVTVEIVNELLNKHRKGKENQFRSYKNWFSIFYPPITFYGHNPIRDFVSSFIDQLISDLKMSGKVDSTVIDFQGARMQGADRFWFAIYNNELESHSKGVQFFVEFFNGNIKYGVYRHSNQSYLKQPEECSFEDFSYDKLLAYFAVEVDIILNDTPSNPNDENNAGVKNTIMKNSDSLNQILYGPPGTGKTYNTVLKAAQIIMPEKTITDYSEALQIFNENLGDKIEFITFHQSYSYEDFIQGLRPDVENEGSLSFERKDGIFKRIADAALQNLLNSEKDADETKETFDVVFSKFIAPLSEGESHEIEVPMKKVSFFVTGITSKSIEFRKNEGDSVHTLSIDTLRKMYIKGVNDIIIGGLQPYYNPILDHLLKMGEIKGYKTEKQNYVLIIDEINRANISRVFGELITLIEPDKRSHGKIPLSCTLPSGEQFIVPSNLYLIGTMNTADKSIALLDIALRRRFEFIPMYPNYDLEFEEKEVLRSINEKIVELKGYDFQIGHAYFMTDDFNLVDCMNNKVIPLMLEYFLNDENEVKNILKYAGLTLHDNEWPLQIIGKESE